MKQRLGAIASAVLAILPQSAVAEDRFVAVLPPATELEIKRGIEFRKAGDTSLAFDLYLPARRSNPVPVVLFVNGIGADWLRGHIQYTSWSRAVTARGLAGVTMDSREASVDEDVRALIAHLTANGRALGIDASRVALWSCSSNVQRGLPLAQTMGPPVRSAVVYYGAADVASFRTDLPVLFVRAGLDSPGLNHDLDTLVTRALAGNGPVEVLNVASGSHGFDIRDDAETSRAAIARTLDFLSRTLSGELTRSIQDGQDLASASAAFYREDWPAASTAYEGLLRTRPQDSLLWQRLGEARQARGDAAGALEALEKALTFGSPNHGMVSFSLASLHAQAGDVDKAMAALEGMRPQLRFFAARLRNEAVFAPLRKDPRLAELLKDIPSTALR